MAKDMILPTGVMFENSCPYPFPGLILKQFRAVVLSGSKTGGIGWECQAPLIIDAFALQTVSTNLLYHRPVSIGSD